MKWTYEELEQTPAWRVEQAFAFLNAEAKQREREQKKSKARG